jgi:hypothetical protein
MGEVEENLNIIILSSLTLDGEGKMGIYSPNTQPSKLRPQKGIHGMKSNSLLAHNIG